MRLLLDTHVLLWWLADDRRLGLNTRALIEDADNSVYVSAASAWEISIKRGLGKLKAPESLDAIILDEGFEQLDISFLHGERAGALPPLHHDPFDRMLVAQALAEQMTLISSDKVMAGYGLDIIDALQ
jgi:PIN domain nuclease of toxin-antitoxin system